MKGSVSKQQQRMENKKKKMAALLDIIKLNDKVREAKAIALEQMGTCSQDADEVTGILERDYQNHKRACSEESDNIDSRSTDCLSHGVGGTEHTDSLVNKKPRLNKDGYARLRQELRERKKRLKAVPRFRLKQAGENASLRMNIESGNRIPIFLTDVQYLLLYSLLGHHSPHSPARWCLLEKYNKVTHTVVLVVEGLSLYHFLAYESMFPYITNNLEHRLECVTPAAYGGSVIEDLAAVPLTGTQSNKLIKQYGSIELAFQHTGDVVKLLRTAFPMQKELADTGKSESTDLPSTDKFPRTKLLLSLWQMVEENYPVPLKGELARKYGDYVLTKDCYVEATPTSPMFGLDCEMCRTTVRDLELTRVSLVDESFNVIYDSLVMPDNPIIDYLTRYSGITKEMMEDVTTTLVDVQRSLRELLPANAILVGQSLNCDLHALRMMHPYVIDTSVIFNTTGDRYRKTKLQILAMEFLGEAIQESTDGHCSTEDSIAALKLTQLKLANSVQYGDAVLLGQCTMQGLTARRSAESRSSEVATERNKYGTSIFTHVTKDKNTAAIVGSKDVINEYSRYLKNSLLNVMDDEGFENSDQVRLVVAENNKYAISRASQIAIEHEFTLCHVRIEEEQLNNEHTEKTFHGVNRWVQKIWQRAAVNGLICVVFTGQNNAANGACFLNVKKDKPIECIIPA